jgi:hypothetical protein
VVAYSFKRRFVAPVHIGLGLPLDALKTGFTSSSIEVRPKTHTIRANGRRAHARPGQALQLYYAQRTKQCFKIGDAVCREVREILIRVGKVPDMDIAIENRPLSARKTEEFARSDGFDNVEDMWLFWRENHADVFCFEGVIVDWKSA